jgi:hypothetical protein
LNKSYPWAIHFQCFRGDGHFASLQAGGADMITPILARFRCGPSMAGYLIADANAATLNWAKGHPSDCQEHAGFCRPARNRPDPEHGDFFRGRLSPGFSGLLNCPTIALIDGNSGKPWRRRASPLTKREMMAMHTERSPRRLCHNAWGSRQMLMPDVTISRTGQ